MAREQVEMIDGRVYYSDDNWATVFLVKPHGKARLVTGEEADLARFLAVHALGNYDETKLGKGKRKK